MPKRVCQAGGECIPQAAHDLQKQACEDDGSTWDPDTCICITDPSDPFTPDGSDPDNLGHDVPGDYKPSGGFTSVPPRCHRPYTWDAVKKVCVSSSHPGVKVRPRGYRFNRDYSSGVPEDSGTGSEPSRNHGNRDSDADTSDTSGDRGTRGTSPDTRSSTSTRETPAQRRAKARQACWNSYVSQKRSCASAYLHKDTDALYACYRASANSHKSCVSGL